MTDTPARRIPATIHERCGMLDDPARDMPCPCRAYAEQATPTPKPRRRPVPPAESPAPALRVLTLDERRAAYSSLPVLDVIAVAAEQDDERKDGAA